MRGTKDHPNLDKIIRSPAAYVGGYWWTIKFFPRGNCSSALSIYLECSLNPPASDKACCRGEFSVTSGAANADISECSPDVHFQLQPDGSANVLNKYYATHAAPASSTSIPPWRVTAQIGMVLYNPDEPRTGWTQSSCHQFNAHNPDWGWTNFHGPWDSIQKRQRGQRRALLQNDTLGFDAYIRIVDDPTKMLWWHPCDAEHTWNCLSLTGYQAIGDAIGNSDLMSGIVLWLHVAPFCEIIQQVNVLEYLTNCDVRPKPLCDALQRFLWQLRARTHSTAYVSLCDIVSTMNKMGEHFTNVTEFWECMRRSLQLELAGTPAANDFAALFDSPPAPKEGKFQTLPNGYNSRIRIPAEDVHSVGEGLERYLGAGPGPWLLPPILHIELDRQKLDLPLWQWKFSYKRVELEEDVDLSPWVPNEQCGKYTLYGYVVHSGLRNSGIFYSIFRPGGPGTKWLRFADSRDNRAECLTQKAAFGPQLGVHPSETVNQKTGHDVAVVAMYVRRNVIHQFLPGPLPQWDAPKFLERYYENGTHLILKAPDEKAAQEHVKVEVYTLSHCHELASLFHAYDIMSLAKSTNNVMYLSVPRSTTLGEVRKRIALWRSADTQIPSQSIRLWKLGPGYEPSLATLGFSRIIDLTATVQQPLGIVRLLAHVLSPGKLLAFALDSMLTHVADVPYFGMPDPEDRNPQEKIPEDAVVERDSSGSNDDAHPDSSGGPSEDGQSPANESDDDSDQSGEDDTESPMPEDVAAEQAGNDAAIAAMIADDVDAMDVGEEEGWDGTGQPQPPAAVGETQPAKRLPIPHFYYFIQIFDVENQCLRTVGSFFAGAEQDFKPTLRKQLGWPEDKDILVSDRVNDRSRSGVGTGSTFSHHFIPDGTCLVVREEMDEQK